MDDFKISDVRITPVLPNKSLIAFCSFLVSNRLYIGSVALHRSPGHTLGYRLVFPDKVLFNGKRANIVYPINRETELYLTKTVVEEYERQIERIKMSEKKFPDKGVCYEEVKER